MKKRFHFEPVEGKALDIIRVLIKDEAVVSCRKAFMALRLAIEELVTNVTLYAYPSGGGGYLDVEIEKDAACIVLRFIDGGIPFNPLERKLPDTTVPLKDRREGGLGILFVIKKMDEMEYAYINQENVLTIKKKLTSED